MMRDASPPALKRTIGVWSAALIVIGGIIGSGIYFTPAETARALPNGAWIIGVWVLGGLIALAGALTYAELGAMLPDAGGPYVYIRRAFGPLAGFLHGWMTLLSIASAALAAVALSFASYVDRFVPIAGIGGPVVVAAVTIVVTTALNIIGLKPGVIFQNILTVAKVAGISALVIGAVIAWGRVEPALVSGAPVAPDRLRGFGQAFVAVLFTVGGWEQMNMVAGEIRDPSRTIPRALVLGIAVVIVAYVGANASYLLALGRDGLAVSGAPAADTATRIFGDAGGRLMTAAVMVSILGFITVALLAQSRVVYAMAKDGLLVPGAAQVHPRFGTPYIAICVMGGWALVLLLATRGRMGALLTANVFPAWIFQGLAAASVLVLRRREPALARPYRVTGYPVVPLLFVLAAIVGIVSAFASAPGMSLVGVAMLIVGVAVFRWRTGARAAA
ncbi:MAG: amino acid permease [Gemmatimonadaceae bacterium]|jgi:APA family basic amino acid/polyamine antiporter|nr:amino acid permease [Gemmatimonadaceae bacterium]